MDQTPIWTRPGYSWPSRTGCVLTILDKTSQYQMTLTESDKHQATGDYTTQFRPHCKGKDQSWGEQGPIFFTSEAWIFLFVCVLSYLGYFSHLRSSKTCCWETEVLNYQLWQLLFLRSLFMSLLCREYNLWYHFAGATQFGTKWQGNK